MPLHDEYHWCPLQDPQSGSSPSSTRSGSRSTEVLESICTEEYRAWILPAIPTCMDSIIPDMSTDLRTGTTFDGNAIVHTLKTGAIALNENRISEETVLRYGQGSAGCEDHRQQHDGDALRRHRYKRQFHRIVRSFGYRQAVDVPHTERSEQGSARSP